MIVCTIGPAQCVRASLLLGLRTSPCARLSALARCAHTASHTATAQQQQQQHVPRVLLDALASGWFHVAKVEGAGRGLVAARPIPYGTEVLRETPLVAIPAHTREVCHGCLATLGGARVAHSGSGAWFCDDACLQASSAAFHDAEAHADLSALRRHCREHRLRFPLLAARLAAAMLARTADQVARAVQAAAAARRQRSHGAAPAGGSSGGDGGSRGAGDGSANVDRAAHGGGGGSGGEPAGSSQDGTDEWRGRSAGGRAAPLAGDAVEDLVPFLCFARVPAPYPPAWEEQHALLVEGLRPAAAWLATQCLHMAGTGGPTAVGVGGNDGRVWVGRFVDAAPVLMGHAPSCCSGAKTTLRPLGMHAQVLLGRGAQRGHAAHAAASSARTGDASGAPPAQPPGPSPPLPPPPQQQEQQATSPSLDTRAVEGLAGQLLSGLTLDWYAAVLSRVAVNAFRVDTVLMAAMPSFGALATGGDLARMASAMVLAEEGGDGEEGERGEEGEGGAGSAVFAVGSLFNHSCEPNVDVVWPLNSAVVAFRAARDIDAGEELRITYTDSHLPLRARRERLQFAYGFTCACALCLEQEELDREAQGRAK